MTNSKVTHKTLAMDAYDIHYYTSGKENQECVIFLHPAFSDHRAFDLQLDFFSQHYYLICIDMIGHGLSKAKKSGDKIDASHKHIQGILDIEKIEKAHIVGVSLGALVAQYYAINYPQKTISLTAVGAYNINLDDKEISKAQMRSNISLVFKAIFSLEAFRKGVSKVTCGTDKGRTFFYNTLDHFDRKCFIAMQGMQHIIKERKVVSYPYPVLIITGEQDIELAHKAAEKWHKAMTSTHYQIIENAGHCAQIDQANRFNDILLEFIQNKTLVTTQN